MKYISTRGQSDPVSFTEAVAIGLAPDGGLYLPEQLPNLSEVMKTWEKLSYTDLCLEFFKFFATDLPEEVLKERIEKSYTRFDHEKVAPLVRLDDETYVLELFHGPTLAFKDFALQLLGNLYEEQIARTGVPINVLGATSGDTGAAAIHGLLGKEGVNIFILYPDGRVSPLQERQMVCTGADNVYAIAVDGTFDDAQAVVKEAFGDKEFSKEVNLSAINSINLARVLAQCVYYIYAYFQLPADKREKVEFVVPTGNFGNVLAGWLASKMGLPVGSFCVATNQNDILHQFFETGKYQVSDVSPSHAPSMDIQVASNFERFLYYSVGQDSEKVRKVMAAFKANGSYEMPDFDSDCFSSTSMSDDKIVSSIRDVYEQYDYIADPHTVCGFAWDKTAEKKTRIVLSTADPSKFPDVIESAIGIHVTHDTLNALKEKEVDKYKKRPDTDAIKEFVRSKK